MISVWPPANGTLMVGGLQRRRGLDLGVAPGKWGLDRRRGVEEAGHRGGVALEGTRLLVLRPCRAPSRGPACTIAAAALGSTTRRSGGWVKIEQGSWL